MLQTCTHIIILRTYFHRGRDQIIHHTIIRQISVHLSFHLPVCPSFCLSLDLHENRSHDSLQTQPMCCPEPVDVQYDLSLYGCGKIIELNDFCLLFAVPSPLMLLSVIPPMMAHSTALLAGDTGWSYTADFPSEQSADKRRTILTLPSVLSALCIAQN